MTPTFMLRNARFESDLISTSFPKLSLAYEIWRFGNLDAFFFERQSLKLKPVQVSPELQETKAKRAKKPWGGRIP